MSVLVWTTQVSSLVGSPGPCNHSPPLPDSFSEVRESKHRQDIFGTAHGNRYQDKTLKCPILCLGKTLPFWAAQNWGIAPVGHETPAGAAAAARGAEPTLAQGTQRFVLLHGAAPKPLPCLGTFPDPLSLGEALGWALGAGKGKQRDRGGKQQEERREPHSQQWKLGLIESQWCWVGGVIPLLVLWWEANK